MSAQPGQDTADTLVPDAGRGRGRGTGRQRRPTAADVAQRAGLSRATVSYVLNDTPHQVIPESTRRRVLDAAAALGYTPSAAARALSSGRSDVVLLLLPDWPIGPSVGVLIEFLSTALAGHGYTFVAHPRSAGRPVGEVWKSITPAAVISFEELEEAEVARLRSAGIELSLALFGSPGRAMDVPEQRTGRLQAEHLAATGHRRLGYAYPEDPRVQAFAGPRLAGVRQACAELGLPEPLVETVPLDPAAAADAVARWHAADPRVSGVAAYNDEVALAVLAGAHRRGLRVPDDLAVVGVDNIPAAAVATPTLTTVEPDLEVLARHIAEQIARRLDGRPEPRRPGSDIHAVVVRESA